MLAQNFKTANELGLQKEHYDALVKTLVMLETDKLKHSDDSDPSAEIVFNMNNWNMRNQELSDGCQTVACIGGSAELIGGLARGTLRHVAEDRPALTALFFPDLPSWWSITTEQAAAALRSYLTTGWPQWGRQPTGSAAW